MNIQIMGSYQSLSNSSKSSKTDFAANVQKRTPPDGVLSGSSNMAYNH